MDFLIAIFLPVGGQRLQLQGWQLNFYNHSQLFSCLFPEQLHVHTTSVAAALHFTVTISLLRAAQDAPASPLLSFRCLTSTDKGTTYCQILPGQVPFPHSLPVISSFAILFIHSFIIHQLFIECFT